jgi:hypothetical protein
MTDKVVVEEKAKKLIEMTSGFSDKYLDEDYKQLCEKLILKMKRKRNVPFASGKLEIWAAAMIYALGRVNFLFDKSFKPYATADDICNYFETSKSTTSQKAKLILDTFKMSYYDEEFSTERMKENNPLAKMAMVNGFIVPKEEIESIKSNKRLKQ